MSRTFAAMARCLSESFFLLVAVFVELVVTVETSVFASATFVFVSSVETPENFLVENYD